VTLLPHFISRNPRPMVNTAWGDVGPWSFAF
jgi:hypothetical protein